MNISYEGVNIKEKNISCNETKLNKEVTFAYIKSKKRTKIKVGPLISHDPL